MSFNPHTHAGCDLLCAYIGDTDKSFNPHTHAGCDNENTAAAWDIIVSIHTPTQGVTIQARHLCPCRF